MAKYTKEFINQNRDINVGFCDWYDFVYEDFHTACDILGISLAESEPCFSGFWSQGDGASWTGIYDQSNKKYDTAPQKIREEFPTETTLHEIADALCYIGRIHMPVYASVRRRGHYLHEQTMFLDHWCPDDPDDWGDLDDIPSEIAELIEDTLIEQFRNLAKWLYCSLEKEHDYLTSDEVVIETLEANDIEEEE